MDISTDRHPLASALFRAAYDGDVERVCHLLSEDHVPIDSANSAGLQALHFASKMGHVDVVLELLQRGASINATSAKGQTPLHIASLLGQKEIVKLLLKRGADVNVLSRGLEDQFTALYMAAQIGHQEIVTLLLAHSADPTISTKNGSTPRDVAQQQGYRALAELLEEYERRLLNPDDTTSEELTLTETTQRKQHLPATRPPTALLNDDVIPSPRNSPMKNKSFDLHLRSTTTT